VARRLTITIEDDVAARLDAVVRREGTAVDEVVSDSLRRTLPEEAIAPRKPYEFPPFTPLRLKPGIDIDNIEELLDRVEGPWRK
jgi:hypothetical protein